MQPSCVQLLLGPKGDPSISERSCSDPTGMSLIFGFLDSFLIYVLFTLSEFGGPLSFGRFAVGADTGLKEARWDVESSRIFFSPALICASPQFCIWPVCRVPWSFSCLMADFTAYRCWFWRLVLQVNITGLILIIWYLDCPHVDLIQLILGFLKVIVVSNQRLDTSALFSVYTYSKQGLFLHHLT